MKAMRKTWSDLSEDTFRFATGATMKKMKKTREPRRTGVGPAARPTRPKLSTLAEVEREVARAREKFPGNKKMLAALMEEVGELARALLQRKSIADVQKEAIQIAATAVRIYEEGDADFVGAGEWGDAP